VIANDVQLLAKLRVEDGLEGEKAGAHAANQRTTKPNLL